MKPTRAEYLRHVLRFMDVPYVYGGRTADGIDCSGLVALPLYTASGGSIDLRKDWWTDRYWNQLEPAVEPKPGDLCLYGGAGADVDHVTILVVPEKTPGVEAGLVVGACGGGRNCTTAETARLIGACVMPKVAVHYRPDFRGYRSMGAFLREAS